MPYPPLSTVPSLIDFVPPSGSKLESISRAELALANIATAALPASGQGAGFAVMLQPQITYSSATFVSGSTALATGTHQWVALLDSTFHVLAVSPDGTSGAWAANTAKTFTFGAAYSPTAQTVAYVTLMVAATTVPTLLATSSTVPSAAVTISPIAAGTTATGQTTAPALAATLTLTASSRNWPYFYLS